MAANSSTVRTFAACSTRLLPVLHHRREHLDHTLFVNAIDLRRKLDKSAAYYHGIHVYRSLNGTTPANRAANASSSRANLAYYAWEQHCNGPFETFVAA
ncbi:MAG TPA: hypothetical protein VND80_01630 [Steroidobacteraceae bacterium]|nr:hypothetical protein [Steroidobacteraceae bacterium]